LEQIASEIVWPIVGPRSPNLVIFHRDCSDWSIPGLVALFLSFLESSNDCKICWYELIEENRITNKVVIKEIVYDKPVCYNVFISLDKSF